MSRWTQAFLAHPFHAEWTQLQDVLAKGGPAKTDSPDIAQELARLQKVIAYMGATLENLDPELVGSELLGRLQAQVPNIRNEVSAFFSDGNIGHLQNANNSMDVLLAVLAQSPMAPYGSAKAALTRAASAYQEAMVEYANSYRQTLGTLASEAEGELTGLRQSIVDAEGAIDKLDSRIATMDAQLPNQLTGYNTAFQQSETARAERFEKWVDSVQSKSDDHFTDAAKKYAAGLEALASFQDQAQKVLGTVVDTAQAGAYATYATDEKKSANLYRRLAIGMMVAAAAVLFLPEISGFLKTAANYTVDWQKALARLPFSLVLFAPALYLAKESSKHRVNEVVNRRRQHILTTIGPYLALLDPAKADAIKADVAKSIFSDTMPLTDEKSGDAVPVLAQVASLVDVVLKKRTG